ncbi:MAG: hypothetical protein R2705_21720 [Ilumatobacteraceae bacterium]
MRQVGREAVVEANGSALDGELISQILGTFKQIEFDIDVRAAGPGGVLAQRRPAWIRRLSGHLSGRGR